MKKYLNVLIGIVVLGALPMASYALSEGSLTADLGVGVGADLQTQADLNADVNGPGLNASATVETKLESETEETNPETEILEENLKATNTNVANIEADSENEVKVEYKHRGRFLGIFPVTVSSETSVKSTEDGSLETDTDMPWWNIFVTGTHDIDNKVEEAISSSTQIAAVSTTTIGVSAPMTTNVQIIRTIIEAHEAAEMEAGS